MKYALLIFVAVMFVFTSCEEEDPLRKTTCTQLDSNDNLDTFSMGTMCASDLCTEYFEIWKALLMEKNNLSQDFMDAHILYYSSDIQSWADGMSFRICYKIKLDWAVAYNCDQFIIKIDPENTHYPTLDLPRDSYLTKDKVKIAVDNRAFSSRITGMTNTTDLAYASMDSALKGLIDFSGVDVLCMNRVTLDNDTGHLILEASAQYKNEENSCIRGTVDLVSGNKNVNDTPCWIN